MKKTLCLLMALIMLLGLLTACGAPAPAQEEPSPLPVTEPDPTPAPEDPAPATEVPSAELQTPDYDPADLHPMLWKVTDAEGHTLYLFGTIHVGDGRTAAVLEKVAPILLQCDALAVEFDMVAYEQDLGAVMADYQQFVYTDGSTVQDHMSEELYARCAELLGQVGAYSPLIDHYNLAMWSQLVQQAALMTTTPLDPQLGMDRQLIGLAYEKELPVLEVESASFQMNLLNSFSDELNLLQLQATLDSLDSYGADIDSLFETWLTGDYDAILALLNAEDEEETEGYTDEQLALVEDYNKALLDDRNLGMAEVALGYLASGDTVFVAVGTAHMVDTVGLVQLLTDAGCTVERVEY